MWWENLSQTWTFKNSGLDQTGNITIPILPPRQELFKLVCSQLYLSIKSGRQSLSLLFYRQMSLCDGHGPDWLEDYKIFYYFWLWLELTSHQTVRRENWYILVPLEQPAVYNWDWLVILFQERDRSPAPGRDATRSLPDLTSWPDISELTRARRTLSAPCVTRDSWDQITWGKCKLLSRTCPPSLTLSISYRQSCPSYLKTCLASQSDGHNTDTLTSGW